MSGHCHMLFCFCFFNYLHSYFMTLVSNIFTVPWGFSLNGELWRSNLLIKYYQTCTPRSRSAWPVARKWLLSLFVSTVGCETMNASAETVCERKRAPLSPFIQLITLDPCVRQQAFYNTFEKSISLGILCLQEGVKCTEMTGDDKRGRWGLICNKGLLAGPPAHLILIMFCLVKYFCITSTGFLWGWLHLCN